MLEERLTTHPLYGLCSAPEKEFLLTYCRSHGDTATAVKLAYPSCKSIPATLKKLQQKEHVAALLDYLDGAEMPSKEDIVKLVWRTARKADRPHEVYRGIEILSDLQQLGVEKPSSEAEIQKLKQELARSLDNGLR